MSGRKLSRRHRVAAGSPENPLSPVRRRAHADTRDILVVACFCFLMVSFSSEARAVLGKENELERTSSYRFQNGFNNLFLGSSAVVK